MKEAPLTLSNLRRPANPGWKLNTLPAAVCEKIDRLLDEDRPGEEILAELRKEGIELSPTEVRTWQESRETERLNQREQLEKFRRLRRFAAEVVQANLGCQLQELGLHLIASQAYELLSALDPRRLKEQLQDDLALYVHLLNAVSRLSDSGLEYEKYRAELAEKKIRIEKELAAARASGGLSPETVERIERELNLF